MSACNKSDDSSSEANNTLAVITLDIIEVTDTSIDISVYGGDDDGVKKVETYLIDAYKLSLFLVDGHTVYVLAQDIRVFDETQDSNFDFEVTFDKVYAGKQYIIRSVASTVNGISMVEEKVSINHAVQTDDTTILSNNLAPSAITSEDRTVFQGDNIALSGTSSTDSDGTIASYQWYDTNGVLLHTGIAFKYTANTKGVHIITLIVTDNEGATDNDTVRITVQ
ncbi:MAG: PKD domain-containing protein [Sulfurovum sp.]|nr:PKD domain-containing protein [Sulfurovum sp.]